MARNLKHIMYGAGIQIGSNAVDKVVKGTVGGSVPMWYDTPTGIGNDDLILDLGLPAILGLVGMVGKKQKYKDLALGAGITGIASFLVSWFGAKGTMLHPSWLPFSAGANVVTQSPSLASGQSWVAPTEGYPSDMKVFPTILALQTPHVDGSLMIGETSSKWRSVTEAQTTPIQRQIFAGRDNRAQLMV